jgi:hypothetical protein
MNSLRLAVSTSSRLTYSVSEETEELAMRKAGTTSFYYCH